MTLAEQKYFATIVHPLKPWDENGDIWAVCIQDNKITEDPELRNEGTNLEEGWTEIRLESVGCGPGKFPVDWQLTTVPPNGQEAYEVYYGMIPDRQLFCRLLRNAAIIRGYSEILLNS